MRNLSKGFHAFENCLLVSLIFLVILLSSGQIILRMFFDQSYAFIDPLIRHLVLWTGMWGAVVAARDDKNLRIEIDFFTSKSIKQVFNILRRFMSFVVCSFLTFHAIRFVIDEYAYGALAFSSFPSWCVQLIFPIVFFFLSLRFLIQGLKTIRPT